MRVRKEWWYVIVLAVLILFLMIAFRDDIGLAPAIEKSEQNSFAKQIGLDADVAPTRQQERNVQKLFNIFRGLEARDG